ncbi:hypothetical protein [Francisella adeliensis]|uniref:Uncharacterized protein n=1 Tax=Francisella adeliensis TaxID=2007306 RepID=A0A2Z4XWZ7_9GAMM|nr:hypothetical protein [Francisella adeliensis]AXA33220.1 hypothetical protein CDH04_01745 [Francisella adeliensis]MBK2085059.1 hypothetical protein [Francisella adeliensis]MBK2096950.1 hypothetical protein [Francisella adeliensis]QIW11448.1 hypothetical protein FZC43_01750 [Francisella adeliensis]QIW13323.1 hypothetical protein FZC44_01750 [Francisella adeliensis]
MKKMTKTVLISLFLLVGIGLGVASETYQGEHSDKKLGLISKKTTNTGGLQPDEKDSSYSYDEKYEDLLTHIDTSYTDDYEIDSDKLDGELSSYEDDYQHLLAEAEKIIGKDKVDALTKNVEEVAVTPKKEPKKIIKIKQLDDAKKKLHEQNDSMAIDYSKARDLDSDSDGENIYQGLLDALKTDKKIDGMFKPDENEGGEHDEHDEEHYKYKMDNGFPLEEIMTVGLFNGEQKRFKKCLILKKYGGGTWRTYCQPLAKPTKCSDQEWRDLSTMPIMYC